MAGITGLKIFVSDKGHGDMSLTDYKNQGFGINDSYLKQLIRRLISYPVFYRATIQNRLRFLQTCRIDTEKIFCPSLGLTDKIAVINKHGARYFEGNGLFWRGASSCDAVITDVLDFPIMFLVADCPVVTLFDQKRFVLAQIHCGRENILKNIVGKTVRIMKDELSCSPENTFAHFASPHLCRGCHFLTFLGFNLHNPECEKIRPAIAEVAGGWEFDVRRAIEIQLGLEGIVNIVPGSTVCTLCGEENYFSHRGWTTRHPDHTEIGRFTVVAMMTKL